jgi:hypothetical protein
MRTKLTYFTALFGATAAAVAILAAPVAAAATGNPCSASGSRTVCLSPGNAQIKDATRQSTSIPTADTDPRSASSGRR